VPKHDLPYALANVSFPVSLSAENSENGLTRGYGTTVGNGIQGWAPGAVFVHTDGAVDINTSTVLYVNIGTTTTASWIRVSDPRFAFQQTVLTSTFIDDFYGNYAGTYDETDDGGTGTFTVSDTVAYGVASIVTAAVDNDYHYAFTPQPVTDLETTTGFWYEARVRLVEAATDDANWFCGLVANSDIGATILGDNGAGPPASYDGAYFYKVDGTMSIMFEASRAATQYAAQTMGTFASNTWYRLGIVWDGTTITPYLDGVAGTGGTGTNADEAFKAGFGVKAGGGNAETLQVDYHKCITWPTDGAR